MLGMAEAFARNFEDAEKHLSTAIRMNPNLAIGHGNFAAIHGVSGDLERARQSADKAIALSPRDPLKAFWLGGVGIGAFVAEAYEDCVENARAALRDHPGFASLMRQEAAALGMLGRKDEAGAAIGRLLDRMPGLTIAQVRQIVPVRHADDHERWLEGLRRAGLPE
jgi:Flp pilus assembly protein TadD